jgi:hypothetical protein
MPEVTATVATPGKVTTTVASSVAATVTTTVTTTAVATVPSRLGRYVGCGHHHTGSSGGREAINSGQGPKGQ